jgi:peptide/nickel transport system substrate-binding protein
MKRIVVLLLALAMVIAMFAACTPAEVAEVVEDVVEDVADDAVSSDDETVGTEEEVEKEEANVGEGEKVYVNDTAILNLDWWAGIGTDSKFEQPWRDLQSLYPHMLWGTLFKMDPYDVTNVNSAIMDLAESMTISDDGLLYTFVIRDDVKWTDGTPFTGADVEFSLTVNLKLVHSMYAANMGSITGASAVIAGDADAVSGIAVDGNTLTVALDTPFPDITTKIFATMQILPKHLLGDVDPLEFEDYLDYWTKPIGTGPWMIDEVSFPNYFTMVQNPDWYGEPVNIQNVYFTSHVTGGVEATLADLIAGNIDYAYGNGVNDIVQAENVVANNPEIQIFTRPSSYQRMFVFNGKGANDGQLNEFMGNKLVRQAIALLTDKAAAAAMYGNTATPLKTAVLPTSSWYNTDIPEWERDVEAAKALLDEAGYDYSKAIRMVYYYNEQTTKDIMDIFVQNFAEVGITVAPFLATGDLGAILYDVRNWDIMYCGYSTANPVYIYDMYQTVKGYDKYMGDSEFRDEDFQPLFDTFIAEGDPIARKAIGDELQVWAIENAYSVPIYGLSRLTLVNTQKLEFDLQWFTTDENEGASWQWSTWNLIDYQ